jgi:hypothetical protein
VPTCFGMMQQAVAQSSAILMEEAIQIAGDYLERTGEIDDPEICSQVLLYAVESMLRQGINNRLLLSNKAISWYQRYKFNRDVDAAAGLSG